MHTTNLLVARVGYQLVCILVCIVLLGGVLSYLLYERSMHTISSLGVVVCICNMHPTWYYAYYPQYEHINNRIRRSSYTSYVKIMGQRKRSTCVRMKRPRKYERTYSTRLEYFAFCFVRRAPCAAPVNRVPWRCVLAGSGYFLALLLQQSSFVAVIIIY